jgi:hypothetical protein
VPLGIVAVIWNCCAPFDPVDEVPNVTLNPAPSLVETPAAKSLEYWAIMVPSWAALGTVFLDPVHGLFGQLAE